MNSKDSHANAGGQVAIAIQERAISENPDAGPDGVDVRDDNLAYTIESRTTPQAVCFDTTQITSASNYSNPQPGDPCHPVAASSHPPAVMTLAIRGRDGNSSLEAREDGLSNAILTPNGGRGGLVWVL